MIWYLITGAVIATVGILLGWAMAQPREPKKKDIL